MDKHIKWQSGFTLVELLISMVLGLLISAAALALFAGSSRSVRVQASAGDVQEAAVFSLSYMENEIAITNLGSYKPMTANSEWTGIILSSNVKDSTDKLVGGNLRGFKNKAASNLLTRQESGLSNVSLTDGGTVLNSDQLTISYIAPFEMSDCQGQTVAKGTHVVERFFTRQDTVVAANESSDADNLAIVLACDAGEFLVPEGLRPENVGEEGLEKDSANNKYKVTVGGNEIENLSNFGGNDNGAVMINRVDYFTVKLGILDTNGIRYVNINDYCDPDCDEPADQSIKKPIVAIKIAVLVRGTDSAGVDTSNEYKMLNSDVFISNKNNQYVRRVYEKTIRLRNNVVSITGL